MFRIADGRDAFFQWDLNRQIAVEDAAIKELHFCNKTDECSLVVGVVDGLANVPNLLLTTSWDVRVYGFTDEYTKIEKRFKVLPRTKPSDYVYTETEVKNYDNLTLQIQGATGLAQHAQDTADEAMAVANATTKELNLAKHHLGNAVRGWTEIKVGVDGCAVGDLSPISHYPTIANLDVQYKNFLGIKAGYKETQNGLTISLQSINGIWGYNIKGTATTPTTFMIMPMGSTVIRINSTKVIGAVIDEERDYVEGAYISLCDENYNTIRVDNDTLINKIQQIQAVSLTIPAGTYNGKWVNPVITDFALNVYNDDNGEYFGLLPQYKKSLNINSGGCSGIWFEPFEQIGQNEYINLGVAYNRDINGVFREFNNELYIKVENKIFKLNAELANDINF